MDEASNILELKAERARLNNVINALRGITFTKIGGKIGGRRRPRSAAFRRKLSKAMKRRSAQRKKETAD